ncbi:hypothetical protein KSB_20270 [Ktedonobacter robiniae]|uniref:Anaphase-promoting complex subunit 4 WD40 domain-containing protein n=1 Tax=Ktedonobacter robiniae TaxID=2778365 RepID=A0ABQ3ULL6_9CHLR|nr:hypothetical protein KSB_20270 [Ktedonobacter robiniae]
MYSVAWFTKNTTKDTTTYLASASADQTVQVIDMEYDPDVYGSSPPASYIYRGHKDSVNSVAWSPDGTHLASASRNGLVRITKLVGGPSKITSYSEFSVVGGDDVLTYAGHKGSVHAVAWSPNGRYLASASADITVQVWDATNGKTIVRYREHRNVVTCVAWSPDGTRLASASSDGTVQVWNATDGSRILTYSGHKGPVQVVAWWKTPGLGFC